MQWNLALNKDTFGTSSFVLCIERLSSFRGYNYRVCIQEYFWLVLCWDVCQSSFGVSFIGGYTVTLPSQDLSLMHTCSAN